MKREPSEEPVGAAWRQFRTVIGIAAIITLLVSCSRHRPGEPLPADVPSPLARPLEYRLSFRLNPEENAFSASLALKILLEQDSHTIVLQSRKLQILTGSIESAQVRRAPLRFETAPDGNDLLLSSANQIRSGIHTLHLLFSGSISDVETSGLFRRQFGGSAAIFSQFEPLGARLAFPCFDSPEFKTPFTLIVEAPREFSVLSNEPVETVVDVGDGFSRTTFQPTVPLPSYLLALAIGKFAFLDLGNASSGAPVRIVLPPGSQTRAQFASKIVPSLLSALESYFGQAYPFRKLDLVPIPTFPGAMENPGLITLNERLLLRDAASASYVDREIAAAVIAHELSHQWFGNYVTMQSWRDLWLNEGFASWLGPATVARVFPDWASENAAFEDTSAAMASDRLMHVRSIREHASSITDIASAFDEITYAKTAAVLRMFEAWLGYEPFRASIRSYIRSHPFGTLRGEDFFRQLEQSFGPETAAAFESFTNQPGLPRLKAGIVCGEDGVHLRLEQERYSALGGKANETGALPHESPALWHIPYCVLLGSAESPQRECGLLKTQSELHRLLISECPRWMYVNANAKGYYYADIAVDGFQKLFTRGWKSLQPIERRSVLRDLKASLESGSTLWGDVLELLPELLTAADDDLTLAAITLLPPRFDFVAEPLRPQYQQFVRSLFTSAFERIGRRPRPHESVSSERARLILLQTLASQGNDPSLQRYAAQLAKQWMGNSRATPAALKAFVLSNGLQIPDSELAAEARTAAVIESKQSVRMDLLALLRTAQDPRLQEANLELLFDERLRLPESLGFLEQSLMSGPPDLGLSFLKRNLTKLLPRMPEGQRDRFITMTGSLCSAHQAEEVKALFTPHLSAIPGGARKLRQAVEKIERCEVLLRTHQESISRFLRKRGSAQSSSPAPHP